MLRVGRRGGGDGGGSGCNVIPPKPLEGDFLFFPLFFGLPTLCRDALFGIWCIVLTGASIGDRDASSTQRSYPVPPGPARDAAPLIFCGVVSAVAPLALPRSREGGSRSQRTRHSAENQKWGICNS